MGKQRFWIGVATCVPLVSIAAWLLLRRQPSVEWIGPAPTVDYAYPSDFFAKPTIDWNLGFTRLTFPKRRELDSDISDMPIISSLLEFRDRESKTLHVAVLFDGKRRLNLPILTEENPSGRKTVPDGMVNWGGKKILLDSFDPNPADRHYIGLPFATNEASRLVTIEIDGTKSFRARLPVAPKIADSEPRTSIYSGKKFELRVTRSAWNYTTEIPTTHISAILPKGTALFVTDGLKSILIRNSKPTRMDFWPPMTQAKAVLVSEKLVKLRYRRNGADDELWSLDGRLVCRDKHGWGYAIVKEPFAIWSRGLWMAVQEGFAFGDGPDSLDYDDVRSGTIVDAYVYKKLESLPYVFKMDVPVAAIPQSGITVLSR